MASKLKGVLNALCNNQTERDRVKKQFYIRKLEYILDRATHHVRSGGFVLRSRARHVIAAQTVANVVAVAAAVVVAEPIARPLGEAGWLAVGQVGRWIRRFAETFPHGWWRRFSPLYRRQWTARRLFHLHFTTDVILVRLYYSCAGRTKHH